MELLPIESSDGFLHLRDLPHNCIFNKVVTGCGGTTVVLSNSEDYVIAVQEEQMQDHLCLRLMARNSRSLDFSENLMMPEKTWLVISVQAE